MKLVTVLRVGDGTFHQAFIPITKEKPMDAKCTFCVIRDGNAVPTDQLVIVKTPNGDYLGCMKCQRIYEGSKSNVDKNTNTQP